MNDSRLYIPALAGAEFPKRNKDELADGRVLALDPGVPQELRADYLLKRMGNPYCFRIDGLGVKLEFPDPAPSLQDLLSQLLQRKKAGFRGM